jgi:cellulose synthase/poly-beta-1,6-N-acetylglucosamine synthase-like glycosyltransferase
MALMTAFKRFPDYDAYVVVDSDVVCASNWLGLLIAPLSDKRIGLSTTFPHFKPVPGSGFWAKVKEVWGFVGNSLLSSQKTRFAWGGSMAFRGELLDEEFYKDFSNSISDDIAITKMVRRKNLLIYYVKERIAYVPSDENFGRFVEWSNRQTAFMILGNKKVYASGVVYYSASIALLIAAITLSFYNLVFLVFFTPFIIGFVKVYARSENKKPNLVLIYLLMNFIYLANLISAKRKHEIEWRGIRYSI